MRTFSPEEAKALLPALRPRLAALREAFHEYRFAKQQVDEMVDVHLVAPDDVELARWRDAMEEWRVKVAAEVAAISEMGADVKDPLLGLIDLYHQRADGSVVLLCYRDDEPDLAYWHPLDTGFSGRRPLDEL